MNSHLLVGPVSFGFGSPVWGLLGSCIHPAPVHSLVYKKSGIYKKTMSGVSLAQLLLYFFGKIS